jgi:sugar phosphate isomerase/epimerase
MHERISVNALCFWGAELPEVADYWRELRPHRVGLLSHLVGDPAAAREVIDAGGYRVETLVHPFMPFKPLDDESHWPEARSSLSRALEIAQMLGARTMYMTTGGHGSLLFEEAADCFSRAIAPCAEEAKVAGIPLLIENALPLYADAHIAHTLRDTITLAEMAGVGVCMDVFGCWTEAGLKEAIERAGPLIGLIQVSDYVYGDRFLPSRAVPGDGVIPLQRILGWALDAGYAGGFDFELLGPRIDEEGHLEATRRAAEHVTELLDSLGA